MKNYLIRLQLQLGDYQKHTYHAIKAETKEAAFLQALKDESHSDDAGYENYTHEECKPVYDNTQDWWDCGEFVYSVNNYRELTDHDFETYRSIHDLFGTSPKYPQKFTKVDLAEQQLLGFLAACNGESLRGLVESMGLKTDELEIIIKKYPNTLDDEQVRVIRKQITPMLRDFRIQKCEVTPDVIRVHDLRLWEQLLTDKVVVVPITGCKGDKNACIEGATNDRVGFWEDCGSDETGVGYIAKSVSTYKHWSINVKPELWVNMTQQQVTDCDFITEINNA